MVDEAKRGTMAAAGALAAGSGFDIDAALEPQSPETIDSPSIPGPEEDSYEVEGIDEPYSGEELEYVRREAWAKFTEALLDGVEDLSFAHYMAGLGDPEAKQEIAKMDASSDSSESPTPVYNQANVDGANTNYMPNIAESLENDIELAWEAEVDRDALNDPIMDGDGTVFIGLGGQMEGYKDGSREFTHSNSGGIGAGTVAVVGDVAVYGDDDGHYYIINADTGDEITNVATEGGAGEVTERNGNFAGVEASGTAWYFDKEGNAEEFEPPSGVDQPGNTILDDNGRLIHGYEGDDRFIGWDLESGSIVFDLSLSGSLDDGMAYDGGELFANVGEKLKVSNVSEEKIVDEYNLGGSTFTTPVVAEDAVYSVDDSGGLYAIERSDSGGLGSEIFNKNFDNRLFRITGAGDTVFASNSAQTIAFNRHTGDVRYKLEGAPRGIGSIQDDKLAIWKGDSNTLEVYQGIPASTCVEEAVSGKNDDQISLSEIQQAIDWWANDEEVPGTDGKTIGLTQIQSLIDTWAEGAKTSC